MGYRGCGLKSTLFSVIVMDARLVVEINADDDDDAAAAAAAEGQRVGNSWCQLVGNPNGQILDGRPFYGTEIPNGETIVSAGRDFT
jgi:hypothetical protein